MNLSDNLEDDEELDLDKEELEQAEEDEFSYQEIYGKVLEDSPLIITVLRSTVDDIKRGVTNAKHATRKKALYNSLPWDPAVLKFDILETSNEEERPFYVDLKISAIRKATVKVKRIVQFGQIRLEDD